MAIKSDTEIGAMDRGQLDAYYRTLSEEDQERCNDALLRINQAWLEGAHSEISDTRRNRRARSQVSLADVEPTFSATLAASEMFDEAMLRATAAGLTPKQSIVWFHYYSAGYTQEEIAEMTGTTQQAVQQMLNRSRARARSFESLELQVMRHTRRIFGRFLRSNWPEELKRLAEQVFR